MLDIAEGRAISTTSVALSQLLQYGNYNYLQPFYGIHCAEVLEAKVGPIIHLFGIATVFRAWKNGGDSSSHLKGPKTRTNTPTLQKCAKQWHAQVSSTPQTYGKLTTGSKDTELKAFKS